MDYFTTVLSTLIYLDLKGHIVLKESVQSGFSGTCDVFTAWSYKHNSKVAVKRVRVSLKKDEKLAKVRCTIQLTLFEVDDRFVATRRRHKDLDNTR